MSEHRKLFDGKTFYWYGWTDVESSADAAKEKLIMLGHIVKTTRGTSPEPNQNAGNKEGFNTWYRSSFNK